MQFASYILYDLPHSNLLVHRNKPVPIKSGFPPKVSQRVPYLGGLE